MKERDHAEMFLSFGHKIAGGKKWIASLARMLNKIGWRKRFLYEILHSTLALTWGHNSHGIAQSYRLSKRANHYTAWFLDPKFQHLEFQTCQFLSRTNSSHPTEQVFYGYLDSLSPKVVLGSISRISILTIVISNYFLSKEKKILIISYIKNKILTKMTLNHAYQNLTQSS